VDKIPQNPIDNIYNLINKNLKNRFCQRIIAVLTLAIATGLLVILTNCDFPVYGNLTTDIPAQIHPLPPTLLKWEDQTNSGNYFDQVKPTKVGYLVWSHFPIQVNIEQPLELSPENAQAWTSKVTQAIQEWNAYLPLKIVTPAELGDLPADITIMRKSPPIKRLSSGEWSRARSALTSYELYSRNHVLSQRFTILLSPSQTNEYVLAAVRHELGHALGIWGHSPLQTDALYFSQVRYPPHISVRDVNTLKLVYQQSTSLGWTEKN